jgi:hypothetical protein
MKTYKACDIVTLHSGVIGLSDNQYNVRKAKLKKKRKGVFDIISSVQFKAGEVFQSDVKDKIVLNKLEEVPNK